MEFNFADVHETICAAVPEREQLVCGKRRFTYAQMGERSRRLANLLLDSGIGAHRERGELANHESGQDTVGLYLYNGPEYLDGMYGCFKARAASFNVNYRYVEDELVYVLADADARGLIYHARFAPRVSAIREKLPRLDLLLQVADDSGNELIPGALDYDMALAAASSELGDCGASGDDLYILYTGGTTGMPKGVLWRSHDVFLACMGGRAPGRNDLQSLAELIERSSEGSPSTILLGPPLMHGSSQWCASHAITRGDRLVMTDDPTRFVASDALAVIERERVGRILTVGDAFAKPLIEALRGGSYDCSSLQMFLSGGAPLSVESKRALIELIPDVMILDGFGSSETGNQGANIASKTLGVSTGQFDPSPDAKVVTESMDALLAPESREVGWIAMSGEIPLGYLGDPEKSARTFPTIDGVRYAVPGDRARYTDEGRIEVLGRDSVTINSGGEKIFAEEVEAAIKGHSAIFDVVVAGRASDRWGQEVVAIVQICQGSEVEETDLLKVAGARIARYKLPKAFVFVEAIRRSPSGKADYRWAKEIAEEAGRS